MSLDIESPFPYELCLLCIKIFSFLVLKNELNKLKKVLGLKHDN